MDRELSQTEIREFIASNGLDKDILEERPDPLEEWRQKCELLKSFLKFIQDKFISIDERLDRLEKREGLQAVEQHPV